MIRPSMQFYPRDWLAHPGLRMCSLAARGLWIDMMSLMHSGEPYGYLTHKGKDILPPVLARLVGVPLSELEGYLHELIDHGVVSQAEGGTFFSGRMVKDEHNRQVRAAGGVKSLDNPNVPQPKKDGVKDTFRPSPAVAVASAPAVLSPSLSVEPEKAMPETALPDSVMEWCRRQEKPVGWISALVAMLKGVGAPGGKAATVDHLAEACSVADRLKGECTPARFNRILIRVMEPEYKSTGHGTDSEDAEFVKASKRLRHIASFHDPLRPKSLTAEGWKVVTPQEREALKNIGTIERVLTAKPEQWTWVVKDFMQAQRGAAA